MLYKHEYKFSLLLTIINFLLFSSLLAQNKEASIKEIRQVVQNINNNKNLKKIVLRNNEFLEDAVPDGGGELTGYFKNGELVKIFESIGISNGMDNTEYYLKNNKLIFAYVVKKRFQVNRKTSSFNYNKTHMIFEGRYYCEKNQLLDAKIKSVADFNPAKDYINELIKQANQYATLLKSKKS